MVIFYDGSCYFCRRQAQRLRRLDKEGNIELNDLSRDYLTCALYGIDWKSANKEIHAADNVRVYRGGQILEPLARALGWQATARFLRTPVIREMTSAGFVLLSKVRKYI